MLEARHVKKIYPSGDSNFLALDDISYIFESGKSTAIVGPSGSGKSTLLNLLAGFDQPSSGQIMHQNTDITQLGEAARAQYRLQHFGFVFQNYNLVSILSAQENIEFPLTLLGLAPKERQERAQALLAQVGLSHRAKHYPNQLSGGEQQRVAIARALVTQASVILADEPTGNLDSKNGSSILDLLLAPTKDGRAVILITHDMQVASRADAILHIRDGKIDIS